MPYNVFTSAPPPTLIEKCVASYVCTDELPRGLIYWSLNMKHAVLMHSGPHGGLSYIRKAYLILINQAYLVMIHSTESILDSSPSMFVVPQTEQLALERSSRKSINFQLCPNRPNAYYTVTSEQTYFFSSGAFSGIKFQLEIHSNSWKCINQLSFVLSPWQVLLLAFLWK